MNSSLSFIIQMLLPPSLVPNEFYIRLGHYMCPYQPVTLFSAFKAHDQRMNGVRLVSPYRQIHILSEDVNFQIVMNHRFINCRVTGAVLSLCHICNLYDDLALFFLFTINTYFKLATIPSFTGSYISFS